MIDLDVLLTNLADPTGQAFAAICFGLIVAVYALLTFWMHVTEPKDTDDE